MLDPKAPLDQLVLLAPPGQLAQLVSTVSSARQG